MARNVRWVKLEFEDSWAALWERKHKLNRRGALYDMAQVVVQAGMVELNEMVISRMNDAREIWEQKIIKDAWHARLAKKLNKEEVKELWHMVDTNQAHIDYFLDREKPKNWTTMLELAELMIKLRC